MSTLLSIQNVHKEYITASGNVVALKSVSYEFEKGKFYAIIGPSGSGKSTLLHILGGLDHPTSGKVFISGEDIYKKSDSQMAEFRRKHMGFIFQQFNLLNEYTVKKNICMPLLLDHQKPDMTYFNEIIETLGLKEKLKKYPSELSGGEQQRVAIARSLLAKPELIIADEPTGNLDQKNGEQVLDLLISCSTKLEQTLIMVTHNPNIAKLADVTIEIKDGEIMNKL